MRVHVCVHACVHIGNQESYLGWKTADQEPEVAFSETVVWGPEMNSDELQGLWKLILICPVPCQAFLGVRSQAMVGRGDNEIPQFTSAAWSVCTTQH